MGFIQNNNRDGLEGALFYRLMRLAHERDKTSPCLTWNG